jgi:hypothetical protein
LILKFKFEGGYLMGHDISGFNKKGEEIAYARFSMGNYNSIILYSLLDANDYFAGVSGTGDSSAFSLQQMEEALNAYKQFFNDDSSSLESDFLTWDQKQILKFIQSCLTTAQKEGSVKVLFG